MFKLSKVLAWTKLETVQNMMKDIYKSRGRCDECVHIGELGKYCRWWYGFTEPDGFCHKFERGESRNG